MTPEIGLVRGFCCYRTIGPGVGENFGCGFNDLPGPIHKTSVPRHYALVYQMNGHGWLEDASGRWELPPGCLYHELAGRPRTVHVEGRYEESFIVLGPKMGEYLVSIGIIDPDRPVMPAVIDRDLAGEIERLVEGLRDAREIELPRYLGRCFELVMRLLSLAQADADPQRQLIDEACQVLAEGLDERHSLEEICQRFDISYERLRKVFKQRMGISPGAYRIRRRIDKARDLLLTSREPLVNIAEELGYSSPYAFSRQFKQVVGISPQSYRRRGHG